MKTIWQYLSYAISAIAAAFVSLPAMIQLLIYAITVDIATGLVAAWTERKLSSDVGRRGIGKKAIMLIAVAGAEIASRMINATVHTPWGEPWSIGSALAAYYCLQEALSTIENLSRAGVPFPDWISQRINELLKQEVKQ